MFRILKFSLASLTFVIIGIAAGPPAQADVVVNGSFEAPALQSSVALVRPSGATWTFTGSSGIINPPSDYGGPPAPDGAQYGFLQLQGGAGSASFFQSITLPSAGLYNLSFFDAGRSFGGNVAYQVFLDSTPIAAGATTTSQPFTSQTLNFNSNAGTFVLSFSAPAVLSGDNTAFFDAVRIVPVQGPPSAVPEPATLVLLSTGLAGVAAARKRRKSGKSEEV